VTRRRAGARRPLWIVAAPVVLAAGLACAPAHDVDTLFKELQSHDAEARQDAAEQLDALVQQGDYKVFLKGLDSPDRLYRAQSIVFLSRMTRPEARGALRDLLRVDRRTMLPFNPIRLKQTSEETDSRILVANLIGETGGDPEAVEVLTAGVDEQPAEVRAATCFALGALRDPKGIPFLVGRSRDPEVEVVRAAAQALGRFRQPEVIEALKALASNPSIEVRSDALSSLEMQESPAVIPILESVGASDPVPELRLAAIEKLTVFKDRSLVPYLIGRLKAPDQPSRAAALGLLGRLTGQDLGPRPDRWERWWAQNGKGVR
jgi:HEAT repeat protein